MTIWTVALLICWLEGGTLDCLTWTGGQWPSAEECSAAVTAMTEHSGAVWFAATCRRRIAT